MKCNFLAALFIFLGSSLIHAMEKPEQKSELLNDIFDQEKMQTVIIKLLIYQFYLDKHGIEIMFLKPLKEDIRKLGDSLHTRMNTLMFMNLKKDKQGTFLNLFVEELALPSINNVQILIDERLIFSYCETGFFSVCGKIQARAILCTLYKDLTSSMDLNEPYYFSETFKTQLPKTYSMITGQTSDNMASTMKDIDTVMAAAYAEKELIAYTRLSITDN